MQLTRHFHLDEFTNTDIQELRFENRRLGVLYEKELKELCVDFLEPIREFCQGVPIIVTSGFRIPALNKAIGGSENSQHMDAEAVDFTVKDVFSQFTIFAWCALNLRFGQLIFYPKKNFIHISKVRNGLENQVFIYTDTEKLRL